MAEGGFLKLVTGSIGESAEALQGAVQKVVGADSKRQTSQKRGDQQRFKYTYRKYPLTLGENTRHPYYVTFFFNIREQSKYITRKNGSIGSVAQVNGREIHSTFTINQKSQQSLLERTIKYGEKDKETIGFGRMTKRTTTAVRLYMPDTLSWGYQNHFRDVILSGHPIGQVLGVASGAAKGYSALVDLVTGGGNPGALSSMDTTEAKALTAEFVGRTVLGDENLALRTLGYAMNPQIDVIYDTPQLRTFNFEFLFAPRSEKEALEVQEIINLFKFHASPELLKNGGTFGRYFVPPSDFDIEFSVDSMGKISSCVLEDLTIDYAPAGAAFYAKNNTPVHTRLTLRFKELEFITKDLIQNEGY